MLTAQIVLTAAEWSGESACDSIQLGYDERHRRRFHYVAKAGTTFLLDLPRAIVLRHGDGLRLSDGRLVEVRAAPEPLMEARAKSAHALLRLAWHIGNRHLPAEIHGHGIRLRQDHVIRDMLLGLGAEVVDVDAPFNPEQGAYAGEGHGHSLHGDDHHDHNHGRGDHHHSHDHHHEHDHAH